MGLFTRSVEVHESRLQRLHGMLSIAFQKVKQDTLHIFDWIRYFQERHKEHDRRFDEIETQLYYMPKSREEIKQLIDSHYKFEHLHAKIDEMAKRLDMLEGQKQLQTVEAKKYESRERLIKRVVRDSKDYVVSVILSMIQRYGKVKASQLKEIVVDEQGLCSKSSFYRILSEIEGDDRIGFLAQGKEKLYLYKGEIIR